MSNYIVIIFFFIEKEVSIYSRNKINNSSFSSGHSAKRVCVRPIKINIKEEVTKYKSMVFILVTALLLLTDILSRFNTKRLNNNMRIYISQLDRIAI